MKHYKFNADELIGWIRLCRPGSICGPQQQYLLELEEYLFNEGDKFRQSGLNVHEPK
jgi:cell division cycle 14